MAEISATATIGFAASGRRVLSALENRASVAAIRAVEAVASLTTGVDGRFIETRVALNRADSRAALNLSVTAGTGIVSALYDLRDGFELAASSLTNPNVNLLDGDGSRVSVLNIQAQADILLNAIDRLVEAAEVGGANLISSSGRPTHLQTTAFGGGANILPQPLDSAGLGLDALNLLDVGGVHDGLAAVNNAIVVAQQRLQSLQILQQVVGGSATFNSQFLASALSDFGAASPDRGTLVDLIG